jgi:predicted ferric reductase
MKYLTSKQILTIPTFITLSLWLLSKNSLLEIVNDPLRSLSQIFSLIGLIYMMIALLLSTRKRFIEDMIGGLDKVYEMHHIVGSVSFVLLINHPLLLAIKALPQASLVSQYLFIGNFLPYNLGVIAIYLMISAFVFMVFVRLPYHIWLRTHQLLGFAGIVGGIHALLITSDISVYPPLRIWMIAWIVLGSLSFLYIFLYYKWIASVYVYEVSKIERVLDVINVSARPTKRKIPYVPGQFAYIGFRNNNLGGEQHPFSFSSAPHEEEVRFSIKMLGDYTVKLPLLKKGDRMYIKGPYGKFGDAYINGKRPLVWIVGGIGVTPFLSMLRNENQLVEDRNIVLFYCFSSPEEGMFSEEIKQLVENKKTIEVHEWCSTDRGRFSIPKILEILEKYDTFDVQICGPGPMMESLKQQFEEIGVNSERILFEKFQML